jgi:hypothetical protein
MTARSTAAITASAAQAPANTASCEEVGLLPGRERVDHTANSTDAAMKSGV